MLWSSWVSHLAPRANQPLARRQHWGNSFVISIERTIIMMVIMVIMIMIIVRIVIIIIVIIVIIK